MGQAIWSVGQGQPLIFTTEGVAWSRLALHVELIYFLLVPLYALFPSPITLYLVQAALYASAGVAVYRLAVRRFGTVPALSPIYIRWLGVACAGIYLLYPVAQTAVLFQFHADTLAMPLLLWAIEALER